jgi:hypothetical protein
VITRRTAWRLAARLAGLALVAYVLATQVRLHDEIVLLDGTILSGTAREVPEGWEFLPAAEGAAPRPVRAEDVQVERYGGRVIPAVSLGFPTLLRRLSGSSAAVAGVVGVLFGLALLTAWRWRWLVEALGLALGAADAIRYTLYGLFFNLVVPGATGGDVVKAWYAAKRTRAPTKAVVSVFVDRAVGLFALVLLAAAVLFLGPRRDGFAAPRLLVAGVLCGVAVFVVLVLSRRVRRGLGLSAILRRLPFQHVLAEIDAAFRLYRRHPASLGVGLAVSVVNHACAAACAFVLARALGLAEVRLLDTLALVPVVGLLTAIPLLPGGWGVGELGFAYFFGQLGVAPSEAVGLSVVFRLATLAASLPGGVLWFMTRDHADRTVMAAEIQRAETAAETTTPDA